MSAIELPDGDYILSEGAAWIEVKGLAIRIFHDGEGVLVSVYRNGHEGDCPLEEMSVGDYDEEDESA